MFRNIIITLLLTLPLGLATFSYAEAQTKDSSMNIKQDVTDIKLYIGVRYFGGGHEYTPFDFTISINDRLIVDNELFPKGDIHDETRHAPDSIMISLRPGTYILKATTKKGDAQFTREFTIEPGMQQAFAQLNYNYLPLGAMQAGHTPPFEFKIQADDFGWR